MSQKKKLKKISKINQKKNKKNNLLIHRKPKKIKKNYQSKSDKQNKNKMFPINTNQTKYQTMRKVIQPISFLKMKDPLKVKGIIHKLIDMIKEGVNKIQHQIQRKYVWKIRITNMKTIFLNICVLNTLNLRNLL